MTLNDGDKGSDEVTIRASDNGERFTITVNWTYCNEPDINYVGFEIDKVMVGNRIIGFETCTRDMTEDEMDQIADELTSYYYLNT